MTTPRPARALLTEFALTAGLMAACLALLAPRPQTGGEDLAQDYLSARALLAGEDPYQPLQPLRDRMGIPAGARFRMKAEYNPHPPAALILTLPFAGLSFEHAYRVFRVVQVLGLAAAWVWACRRNGAGSSATIVVGGAALGLWPPVWGGLDWGQPVGVLALLAVALWELAGTRQTGAARAGAAGMVFALSCLVRPLFAGVAAAAGAWPVRRLAMAVAGAVGVVLGSFLIVGITPREWHHRAARAGEFADAGGSIPAVLGLPAAAGVAGFVLWIGTIAVLARRGLPAREAAGFGLAGGLLWYPLAWFHYDVVLIPVAVWAAAEGVRRGHRPALLAVAGYIGLRFVPPYASIPGSMTWFPVAGRLCLVLACAMLAISRSDRDSPVTSVK